MEVLSKYPTVLGILECGYGPGLVQTLTDSIQNYARALGSEGEIGSDDADNIYTLVWLLKAVLKDCCQVEVK